MDKFRGRVLFRGGRLLNDERVLLGEVGFLFIRMKLPTTGLPSVDVFEDGFVGTVILRHSFV